MAKSFESIYDDDVDDYDNDDNVHKFDGNNK